MGQRGAIDTRIVERAIGDPPIQIERVRLQLQPDEGVERVDCAGGQPVHLKPGEPDSQSLDPGLIDCGDPRQRLVDVLRDLYIAHAEPRERRD